MSVFDGPREEWRRILHEGQPKWVKPEGDALRLGDGRLVADADAIQSAWVDTKLREGRQRLRRQGRLQIDNERPPRLS